MGVRNYSGAPRVYVDMDGVIADFDGAMKKHGVTGDSLKTIRGIYQELDEVHGAHEALNKLKGMGFEIFILTKIPASNPHAATEKLLWVAAHFPHLHDQVIITPDKGAVGTIRDYLVDDRPDWANANNFPGTLIHFDATMPSDQAWKSAVQSIRQHAELNIAHAACSRNLGM